MRKETGNGRKETGERRRKKGDGRKRTGERRREKGDGRKETGDGRRERVISKEDILYPYRSIGTPDVIN